MEKKKESFHAENAKLHEFHKTINEFLDEDKNNASQRNAAENYSGRGEENNMSSHNATVVNNCNHNCDETHEDSEEEGADYLSCDDSGSDMSMCYASDEEEDYEEWRK